VTTVTSKKKHFAVHAAIQATWMVAPCEMFTLQNYRLARGSAWMEYRIIEAEGCSVEMVRWKPGCRSRKVNLLEEGGSLDELGSLTNASAEELVKWVSRRGLLGFRPSEELLSNTSLLHVLNVGGNRADGPENTISYTYEPLSLIREATYLARSAFVLFEAIRIDDAKKRQCKIADVIQINPKTGWRYVRRDPRSGGLVPDSTRFEMWICGVHIGQHIKPRTPVQWTNLAVQALSDLTERCLSSEFTLYWSEAGERRRTMANGWKIRSLVGGLFLKMAHRLSERRYCQSCCNPLSNRARPNTKTCGARCRQQLKRKRDAGTLS